MDGEPILINIRKYLAQFRAEVEIVNSASLYDINKRAETVLMPILNEVFECSLINANVNHADYPAVDLIDLNNRTAFQITSTPDSDKIKKTLITFFKFYEQDNFDNLYVYVISKRLDKYTANFDDIINHRIQFDVDKNVIDHSTIYKKLEERITDIDKLKRVEKILSDQFSTSENKKSSKYLNAFADYNLRNLVGRISAISSIHNHFTENNILLLRGMGGLGKTILAKAYIEKYKDEYENIAYIENINSLSESILARLSEVVESFQNNPNLTIDQNLEILVEKLRHIPSALLVIDNSNDRVELLRYKPLLQSLSWKVLITSRCRIDLYQSERLVQEVETLSESESIQLFEANFRLLREDEIIVVKRILKTIKYHTKLNILLAKAAFRNRLLDLATLADKVAKNDYQYNPLNVRVELDLEERRVYEFVLLIFNPELLSKSKKQFLRYFSVLPIQDISIEHLKQLIMNKESEESEYIDTLISLVQDGWLESSDYNFFRIHPLVQLVCEKKLKPNISNCQIVIDSLISRLIVNKLENINVAHTYLPYLDSVITFFQNNESRLYAELLKAAAVTYSNLGKYQKAYNYNKDAAAIIEAIVPIDEYELAVTYNNLGSNCRLLGKLNEAHIYNKKALDILQKEFRAEYYDFISNILNSESLVYAAEGDILSAYKLIKESVNRSEEIILTMKSKIEVSLYNKILPHLKTTLSNHYLNAAAISRRMNDYEAAMQYDLDSIKIREQYLSKDDPDLAYSYNNTAVNYKFIGKYEQAIFYHNKAIAIRTKIYPSGHPEITIAYNNLAGTYRFFGKFDLAITYLLKAVDNIKQYIPLDQTF